MANWRKTIKIKDLLEEYNEDADELEEIARVKPLWVERFVSIAGFAGFAKQIGKVKTLSQFNRVLGNMYNYCDSELIWVD